MDSQATTTKRLLKESKSVLRDHVLGCVIGLVLLWFLPRWLHSLLVSAVFALLISSIFGTLVYDLKPRKKLDAIGKAVLITGCDTGFGHMLASRLDDLGFLVFAGCLFPDGDGAKKLQRCASERLHIFGMDVTKEEDVQKSLDYVKQHLGLYKFWAVVCNAGVNDGAEVLWTDMRTIDRVIDINLLGVIRVTKAFLPLICKSKGRVIAVSSAAGRHSFPNLAAYCASKHAVIAFCDSLRMEMYKFGVKVITIEPWMYKTPISDEDTVKGYVRRTWAEAPEDIKDLFPTTFIDWYPQRMYEYLMSSIRPNPGEVVSCMEEALIGEQPKYSYNPGSVVMKISMWFIRKLPRAMMDTVNVGPAIED